MMHVTLTDEEQRWRPVPRRVIAAALIAGLAFTVGCSPLRQRREAVEPSGFLHDYSQLKENDQYKAYLVYINPKANWSNYNAIMIDSVSLWAKEDKLSPEDRQMLTSIMYNALFDTLAKNFAIVKSPGMNVLRLRMALTEAEQSKVVLNLVTSVVPQLRVLTTVGGPLSEGEACSGCACPSIPTHTR